MVNGTHFFWTAREECENAHLMRQRLGYSFAILVAVGLAGGSTGCSSDSNSKGKIDGGAGKGGAAGGAAGSAGGAGGGGTADAGVLTAKQARGEYLVDAVISCGDCHTPQTPTGPSPGNSVSTSSAQPA